MSPGIGAEERGCPDKASPSRPARAARYSEALIGCTTSRRGDECASPNLIEVQSGLAK